MDLRDARAILNKGIKGEDALAWFVDNLGDEIPEPAARVDVSVRLHYGSAMLGAPDAEAYLTRAMMEFLPRAIAAARKAARADWEAAMAIAAPGKAAKPD